MSDAPKYATLRDYLRVLREHRLLIALTVIVFGAAGYVVVSQQAKTYAGEATLSVPSAVPGDARAPAITASRVSRLSVAEKVKKELDTEVSAGALQGAVSARVDSKTDLVIIRARWREPRFAARIANGFAREVERQAIKDRDERLERAVQSVEGQIRKLRSTTPSAIARTARRSALKEQIAQLEAQSQISRPVEVVRFSGVSNRAVSPKPVLNTLLGLLIGLTIGVIAAFVRDALDRRLRGSTQIQEHLGLPLLGHVRDHALGRVPGANGGPEATEQDLEAFRILRVNLEFVFGVRPRTVAVTSGLPEEGKSTVAVSLASVSATAGLRTLLVECDLRRPSLARRVGIAAGPGLAQYLEGTTPIEEIQQEVSLGPLVGLDGATRQASVGTRSNTLTCVTAGSRPDHPADLLSSHRFAAFLEQVRERFDLIVLDTAPLLSVVDAREVLPHVDGVLLCVRAARTTDDEARAAKQALEYLPDRPTGLVVTGVRARDEADYGYYSYAYSYEP